VISEATGCDGVPAELLKLPVVARCLLPLINFCLASGTVPEMWHMLHFAMIPKAKGSLTSADNWRYIALLCVVVKVYDALLLKRLATVIDPALRFNQNGFRRQRGTLQHITAWHAVLDAARQQGMPLAASFVDFTNAFPSISWKAIRAALVAYNVPPVLVAAVLSIYERVKGQVRTTTGLTDPFTIDQGVMQGDTLAPFLFVLVLDLVLRKALDPLRGDGILVNEASGCGRTRHFRPELRMTDMNYADDIVLMSHTVAGLQRLLEALEDGALAVGLKINFKPGKTECMLFNVAREPLTCHSKPVVLTEDYKYLGCMCIVDKSKEGHS
jgi:hypothetical protein